MENILTQRIARIHEEAFIIDAHFDLLSEVASRRDRGENESSKIGTWKDSVPEK